MDKRIELKDRTRLNYMASNDRGLFYVSLFLHKELTQEQADELALLIEHQVTAYVNGGQAS